MFTYKPVTISRGGFAFCRYSVAVALWVGVLWRMDWLMSLCAVVMLLSAILTVSRAPMVLLYASTIDRLIPSAKVVVDESGLRFAQSVAAVVIGVPWLLLQFGPVGMQEAVWRFLPVVAVFKTLGALGFCAVSRLYTCAISGGDCCAFLKGRSRG
jgi:hypothetical protein